MQHHRDECILIRNIRSKNFLIENRGIASFSRSKERNTGREIDGRSPTSAPSLSPVPPALSLFHCLCLFPPDPSFDPLSLTERTSLFLFVVFSSFSTSSASVSFLSSFSRQFTSASKYSQRLKTGQQKRREPRFSIFPRLPRIRRSCTDHFGIPRMVQSIPGISRGLRTANFLPTWREPSRSALFAGIPK